MFLQEINRSTKAEDRVSCFLFPNDKNNQEIFNKYINEFTGGKKQKTLNLEVNEGRCIKIPGLGKTSRIDLDFLITNNFGAADFRALFDNIRVLFLEVHRQIDVSSRNECARFIMMVC